MQSNDTTRKRGPGRPKTPLVGRICDQCSAPFELDQTQISNVVRRVTWKHVPCLSKSARPLPRTAPAVIGDVRVDVPPQILATRPE